MSNAFLSKNLKWGVLAVALFSVFYFFQNFLSPAAFVIANPMDYIEISHISATFSKSEILGDEVFYSLFSVKTVWAKSFPFLFLAKEAKATFSIEAQNKTTGAWEVLNSAHTVDIKSIPKKKGESFQFEDKIPLQFPRQSEAGGYKVAAKIAKVEIKFVLLGWINLAHYLPKTLDIGAVKYASF